MAKDAIFIEQFRLGGDGPRVAIKDCIDIAGWPTRAGSEALVDAPPASRHADVVEAILAAGGCIVGKANMHELAYGVTGVNRWLGTPRNTRYPDLIPGGSSSGSAAAIAAGLADVAIGTDTGGSIRMPAACCGVAGLKPSFGRVSRRGCTPASSSLDCVGPFARNVAGLEMGMSLIDPTFQAAAIPAAVRLGWVATEADEEIVASVRTALQRANVELIETPLDGLQEAFQAGVTIMAAEMWELFGALAEDPRMGADVQARLRAAASVTPAQVAAAEAVRKRFRAIVDNALANVDALVLPVLPSVPPRLDDLGDAARMLRLTSLIRPFNLTGHPALCIPIDGPGGFPAAIQLVGAHMNDAHLCAVARRVSGEAV
ncbi:amidase [Sphingobium sp. BS19]|uniref:amidase n=1 Tax=Sphingobium sp. BS19 TaxID=3018973 RepID=UPI002492F824|nr:amidase [Sphingobium sp. BS19]